MHALPARGRTAVVFGASGQIGQAVARRVWRAGASVALHYHSSADAAHALVDEARAFAAEEGLDSKATAFKADLGDARAVAEAHRAVLRDHGSYYYAVHLQDFPIDPRLWNLTDAAYAEANAHRPYEIAYVGTIHAIEAFAPHMVENRAGSILITGSSAVFDHYELGGAYTAAKTALALVLPEYARVLGRHGVRINGGAWGWVPKGTEDPGELASEARTIPLWRGGIDDPSARFGTPALIADAAMAILDMEFLHGQFVLVDGGQASPVPWAPDPRNVEYLGGTGFRKRYAVPSKLLGRTL